MYRVVEGLKMYERLEWKTHGTPIILYVVFVPCSDRAGSWALDMTCTLPILQRLHRPSHKWRRKFVSDLLSLLADAVLVLQALRTCVMTSLSFWCEKSSRVWQWRLEGGERDEFLDFVSVVVWRRPTIH